jgi:lysophospholipase L1-like esterase
MKLLPGRAALLGILLLPIPASAGGDFPLRDGDTWVLVGDSITAQHLHSDYFEAFCFARYPRYTFRFRNAGTSGDTVPRALARFDWDVAAWKPTVVSVELGINDQADFTPAQYLDGLRRIDSRIRDAGARPVYFSPSVINNGETSDRLAANARLHQYAVGLRSFAAEHRAPFADQFHALIDVWGKNKPREMVADVLPVLNALAREDRLEGVEHLRAFLAAQENSRQPLVSLRGDPTHIGPPGQLMMAAALLRALGATGFVSHATLDASGRAGDIRGCTLDGVKAQGGALAFDRLDEALPFPLADEARPALALFPAIMELSPYTLKVTGLPEGRHTLKVNGVVVTTLAAREWAAGVNLTAYSQGPIAAQGKAVLAAVSDKEKLVWQWRELARNAAAGNSSVEVQRRLQDLARQVEAADGRIREAARPRQLHFELAPAS